LEERKSGAIFLLPMSRILYILNIISDLFSETRSCYIAHAGFGFAILFHKPPEYWDYRHVPPPLAYK
jgi:hypothetical protein